MKYVFIKVFLITLMLLSFSCSPEDGKNGLDGVDGIDGITNGLGTLILTGDITNEDAVKIIEEGVGEDTHTIVVSNTTNVTTLDLSRISVLAKLEVIGNEKLENLNLSNLKSILDEGIIRANNTLTAINLENLTVIENLRVSENNILPLISLPKLLSNAKNLYFFQNPLLENLSIPSLTQARTLFIANLYNLTSIDINTLENVSSLTIRENKKLTTINLANLVNAFRIKINDNDMIKSITFSNLERVTSNIDIKEDLLEVVEFSKLTTFPTLNIDSTVLLTTVDFPLAQDFSRLQLNSSGKLSTGAIDQVITTLVNITPSITETVISISGIASAQALIDTETLRTNGNTVNITE
ncbi:hypothetical protein [Aquimarina sp. MAR_2010_214]|uniref:hypothetical protein n=1 Tax=Aquimarina sp. MAR_2010_214 TaxID=1250026 RepID=UPI000C706393|nr:hypothetical protein [Aquimarina sp. MAR_2010_214]